MSTQIHPSFLSRVAIAIGSFFATIWAAICSMILAPEA